MKDQFFRGRSFLSLCFLVLFVTSAAHAEDTEKDSSTWLEHIGRDLMAPVLSPGRDYLLVGAGLSLAAYPFRKTFTDVGEDKPLGSTAGIGYQLGFWKINAAYIGAFLGYGLIAHDPKAIQESTLMIRATVYTGLLTTGIKDLHLEERPRGGGDFNSFPSGHASNSFAFAGVVYRNHGLGFGIPAFAMASFVSFSRMNDNAHYLHDVLFGGAIGLSYSMGLDTSWTSKDQSRSVAMVPIIQSDALGLGAIIEF